MATYDDSDERTRPLGFLITFRTYGTWLHGDERHSVDTHDHLNVYGFPDRAPNSKLKGRMRENLIHKPTIFDIERRDVVKAAIEEVCDFRKYPLHAINVRSNHVHAAVSSLDRPETVAETFKRYSTRRLRNNGYFGPDVKIWSRGCSTRYLWKEKHLGLAIEYVLYGQGDELFAFE